MKVDSPVNRAYYSLALVSLIWGTTYLGMKYGTDGIPPFLMTSIRQTSAAILMLLGLKVLTGRSIAMDYSMKQLLPGILMIAICNGLITASVSYLQTGIVSILVATSPFWVLIMTTNWLRLDFKRERLKFLGVITGLTGTTLVFVSRGASFSDDSLTGVIMVVIAAMSWAGGLILNRQIVLKVEDPVKLTAYQMLTGGLTLVPVTLLMEDYSSLDFTVGNTAAILYLAVFGSIVGFIAYNYSLKILKPLVVSLSAYAIPLVSILLGVFLAGEKITAPMLGAAALILAGIYLVHRAERQSG